MDLGRVDGSLAEESVRRSEGLTEKKGMYEDCGLEDMEREKVRVREGKLTLRRGLVGMANSGKRNTNTSQFFFTLDKADELTNKHTMFGKVVGNTIYSGYTFPVKLFSQGHGDRAAKTKGGGYEEERDERNEADDRFNGPNTIGCR